MATTCPAAVKDDPMDLGPFLQEYVLQNPFSMKFSKTRPIVPQFPPVGGKKDSILHPICRKSPPPPPLQPAAVVTCTALPLQPIVTPVSQESRQCTPIKQEEDQERTREYVLSEPGKVFDTSKGHIGSNTTFAEMLKANLLPPKHVKVRNWLLKHYCFIRGYGGWVSSEDLLTDVKKIFPQMKSCVLSRIIRFTFPDSRKIINKYGYFYEGLVRKPKKSDFRNNDLTRAVADTEAGKASLAGAAQKYSVSEFAITNMRLWRYHLKEQQGSVTQHVPELESPSEDEVEEESDDSENNPVHPEQESMVESPVRPSEQFPILRWKLHCRSKLKRKGDGPPSKRMRQDDQGRETSPSDDEEKGDNRGGNVSSCGDSTQDSDSQSDIHTDGENDRSLHQNNQSAAVAYFTESQPDASEQSECLDLSSKVRIKEEPEDPLCSETDNINCSTGVKIDDDSTSSFHDDKQSFKPSNVKNSPGTKTILSTPSVPGPAGHRSERTVNVLADMLSSRRMVMSLQRDLAAKDEELKACKGELNKARAEIQLVKSHLRHKHDLVTGLAEQFFQLSNQFMKLSHSFKQALLELETDQPQ